jgi:tetratricopeptide (TPR) repeat protein
MTHWRIYLLAVFLGLILPQASHGEEPRTATLDALLLQLSQSPEKAKAEQISEEVWALFFDSGSPTVDLLLQRGITAQKTGMLDLASDFFGDVIEFAPDFAEGYNRRAGLEYERGQYKAALEDLNKTLELQPRHFGAFAGLGLVLERLGADAPAYEAYQDALAINPFEETAKAGAARLAATVKGRSL